ncbi:purine-binding chemotaxis protein CheW [Azospirillaceae bacterium]
MASLSADDVAGLSAGLVIADTSVEQYIIFTINEQEYGVSIMAVREIRGWTPENKLPNLPPYIRGVINLRGTVIPIIDLRARFGGHVTESTKTHVVIVMQVGDSLKGVLVDAISDILPIPRDQIKPAPEMESDTPEAHYVSGLYTPEGRIIALLGVTDICSTAPHHAPALEAHGEDSLAFHRDKIGGASNRLEIAKPN